MLEYHLNKMFFELHNDPQLADEFRLDRKSVMDRYPLTEAARNAVIEDNIPVLAAHSNGFLLRYYFLVVRMSESDFIDGLRRSANAKQDEIFG